MSNRNDYNYFDLDNFDDDLTSANYRRRHPQGRNSSYNNRPVYNVNRRRPRRNRRRTRNRIIIVSTGVALLVLIIVLFSAMVKGCSGNSDKAKETVSTQTKEAQGATPDEAVPAKKESSLPKNLQVDYFATPEIKDDNTNGYSSYGVYVWNKAGYELFGSSDEKAKTYADTINGFADKFGKTFTVYDMVVPNHTEMGLPQRLKDGDAGSGSQAENIKKIYSYLSDSVTPINCYNYLAEHNSEYIYFNSDHHWSGLGAYYAYKAFADSTEQKALSLEDCTEQTIEGFRGSFGDYSNDIENDVVHYWQFPYSVEMNIYTSAEDYDSYESPYYDYAAAGSNTYGVFILGDNQATGRTVLKSSSDSAESGKKIAVVKESYGNAFVPYLTNNYEEVHVIDFRYFKENLVTYCQQNDIYEVMFVNGVMSANTQIQLDSMSGLFN